MILEIDGSVHQNRVEYDQNRDRIINELGIRVLRIKNEEVKDMDTVKKKILEFVNNMG